MQNFKKRTPYLNRGKDKEKQKLYKIIKNLPLSDYEEDYLEDFKYLLAKKNINKELKDYLQGCHKQKEVWVKCY